MQFRAHPSPHARPPAARSTWLKGAAGAVLRVLGLRPSATHKTLPSLGLTSTHGLFTWNELVTNDPAAACAFFTATLGWTFEEFRLPQSVYWIAMVGERYVAGICGFDEHDDIPWPQSHWVGFVEVDDVDARIASARAQGARIVREPHDVMGVGRVAMLRDPTGAYMGWMTSIKPGG
ncbi:VOC family protein [Microvirga pudoricolor]|uniref:VOC family protein n=1 Tax=Microvirga pudoricolor TaxID=2778729 RepID=UPI001950BD18|nr:VOC family protein [Microvirga pudoricolor]MBM6593903.1 VOC family protein [Microvirga pudoricolor]